MNVQSTQSESTPRRLTLSKNLILDEENSDFEDLDELPDLDPKIEKPTSRRIKSKLATSQDHFSSFETSFDLKTEILSETKGQLILKCLLGVIVSTKKPTKVF